MMVKKKKKSIPLYAILGINLLAGLYAILQSTRLGCHEYSDNESFSTHSFADSVRKLWWQLQRETPFHQTRQRVITNLKSRAPSKPGDVVLVTHGSLFKMDTFLTQMEHWNGPASFAVYMNTLGESKPDALDMLEIFLEEHQEQLEKASIHLYMEYTKTTKQPPSYPHNPLRNLAMDESNADFIVALDVDFIPLPKNCYRKLHGVLHEHNSSLATGIRMRKRIMVLPAFEVYALNGKTVATKDQLPSSKKELYESIQANLSESFRLQRYPAGHSPTNFDRWFDPIVNPQSIYTYRRSFAITYRLGFEPYVLAYRHGLPRYWNTFRGFGQNKLSWFLELHRAGYDFGTLLDFYVVHLEHPSTANWEERHDNLVKYEDFLDYLNEIYPLTSANLRFIDRRFYYDPKNKGSNNTRRVPGKKRKVSRWQTIGNLTKYTNGKRKNAFKKAPARRGKHGTTHTYNKHQRKRFHKV